MGTKKKASPAEAPAKSTSSAKREPAPKAKAKAAPAVNTHERRDGVGHWLVKIEHDVYPWSRFVTDKSTVWDGVRNYTARNNLRAMKVGDRVLFYHSGDGKCVMGVASVTREAFEDPTAPGEDWSAVELAPVRALEKSVSLADMKKSAAMEGFMLFRQPQLSVLAVTPAQFDEVLRIGKTSL